MGRNLKMPWSMEDTVENMVRIRDMLIKRVRQADLDGKSEEDVRAINFDFSRVEKALKKHIPAKPLRGGNTDKPTVDIFICPSCSGVVGIDDTRADYCADCGQKLDWETNQAVISFEKGREL